MTDPTDKQLEWADQLLCAAENRAPSMRLNSARRLLAELERQGMKVCR